MSKFKNSLAVILAAVCICGVVGFGATPIGREIWNRHFYSVQKADDATNYKTRKKVEDTCRAMMASYVSDEITYQQYKDSDNEGKQSWAEQARMRANKTAATYNEYILKNSYVWENNVPNDIKAQLSYI